MNNNGEEIKINDFGRMLGYSDHQRKIFDDETKAAAKEAARKAEEKRKAERKDAEQKKLYKRLL